MSNLLPLYGLSGVAMAIATLGGLVWVRLRRARPQSDPAPDPDPSSQPTLQLEPTDYEQLFNLNPHPMFVYDIDSLRLLDANPASIRRYGYERSEFLQLSLADIRPPEDVPAMKALAREMQKIGSAMVPGIWRHRCKNGSLFHVRVSGHELPYGGRQARMVQVIDVSAEVALQAEREQMIAKLQHSREWLATTINAGRIGLWERDLIARTLVLGGRWADILGTTAQAFGAVTEQSFIDLCHADDLPRAATRFAAYLKDPSEPYADEFRLKHAQGQWVWVLAQGKLAERTSDGRARRIVGTYVDISELKAAQSAREQQRAAEQASAMKTQFLGRVSHELRTPLNAVIGFSQLMQLDDSTPLTPQQAERLAHIERAGQHLLGLITDLMDLSRIELGAVELQCTPLDAGELLADSLAMVGAQLQERQLAVSSEIEPGPLRVVADPLRLRQCLLNLLSNAIKYSHSPGAVRVGARAAAEGEVALSVWNSGVGLTPAQLERLYEPFNRLGRDASHAQGTGIGLAISRQLIERMGGRIEATSEAGAWAQFSVTLPAAR